MHPANPHANADYFESVRSRQGDIRRTLLSLQPCEHCTAEDVCKLVSGYFLTQAVALGQRRHTTYHLGNTCLRCLAHGRPGHQPKAQEQEDPEAVNCIAL